MMKLATLCSGIGAPEVAAARLGWPAGLWCAEIEKFPSAVLAARFPGTPNLGDMTAEDFVERARAAGVPDVLMAGTPCQAFSVAGQRKGLSDARGNLTLRFVEICDELDPDWIVWENVPGALSLADNAFGCLLGGLAGTGAPLVVPGGGSWPNAGVVAGPRRRLVWRVLDAQHFGVAQRRKRVFVVASRGDGSGGDPVGVLFERAGVSGCAEAGRGAGETVGALTASGVGTCGVDDGQGQAGHLIPVGEVAHTLTAEGHDASEDGTGRSGPIVPQLCGTLCSMKQGMGGPEFFTDGHLVPIQSFNARQDPVVMEDRVGTLDRFPTTHGLAGEWGVRRLMPVECERLQGFDDGWTEIDGASKTAQYKAIGNSMAVPCVEWIFRGIMGEVGGWGV